VGKSTFLRALELFYNPTPRITADDFYGGDITNELVVRITYRDLPAEAIARFSPYVQGSLLAVERVFRATSGRANAPYFGEILRHSAFQTVRKSFLAGDRAATAKSHYAALRGSELYSTLPGWSTIASAEESLAQWEMVHPELCAAARDDGLFFGFNTGGRGDLSWFTRLLYIPAVRDAIDDAQEGRGSVLSSLMDLLVRKAVATRPEIIRLKARSQLLYQRAFNPGSIPELVELGDQLTATLRSLVPDAEVQLSWNPLMQIELPLPTADVKVIEEGYPSAIERTGHGLQRAFIMTVLQHLTIAQASGLDVTGQGAAGEGAILPSLVLVIEEPELYQHPNRQRHFARTLNELADGISKGVAERTQVLYGTHSPLFVSIDAIHRVRLLRRVGEIVGHPKVTRVVSTRLDEIARTLWDADNQPSPEYSGATLLPRLRAVMNSAMSEGFFADTVVLVEGEDDRAALLGVAQCLGHDLESRGITIIPCGGKTCLDRPFVVFTKLSIPVYMIWDGDKGAAEAKPNDNHRLLRLVGGELEDWPSRVADRFACFEVDLETTLRTELTPLLYDSLLTSCQQEFGIPKKKHAQKNPYVVAQIVEQARLHGGSCPTIEAIVAKLVEML